MLQHQYVADGKGSSSIPLRVTTLQVQVKHKIKGTNRWSESRARALGVSDVWVTPAYCVVFYLNFRLVVYIVLVSSAKFWDFDSRTVWHSQELIGGREVMFELTKSWKRSFAQIKRIVGVKDFDRFR